MIPVPLHKRRLSWRGFNQAQAIADQLNNHLRARSDQSEQSEQYKKISDIKFINDLLIRSRYTYSQMEISDRKQRINNVSHAFKINDKIDNPIKNKSVVLLDDICTTASTFENCAMALQPLKPRQIWGLAVARG